MVIEDVKNIKWGREDLKKFGIGGGVFFLAIAIIVLVWKKEVHSHLLVISAVFFLFAFTVPKALKPIYAVWMPIALTIGWVITRIILGVLFFLVFTPIGLIMKAFNKTPLELKINKKANSYWAEKEGAKFDKKSYENQF